MAIENQEKLRFLYTVNDYVTTIQPSCYEMCGGLGAMKLIDLNLLPFRDFKKLFQR